MERTKSGLTVLLAVAMMVSGSGAFWAPVATAADQSPSQSVDISSPSGTYFVGQTVNVTGTANQSVGSVALYARSAGDWQLLDVNRDGEFDDEDTVPVGEQGNWSVRNLVLSNANRLLSYPGDYRLGVVNASAVGGNGTLPSTLTPSEFVTAGSSQSVLRVNRARLRGSFVTVGGQLPTTTAEVTVRGTSQGNRELLVVLVDSRGRVGTDQIQVPRGNGSFDVDVPLRTGDGRMLAEGPIQAYVLALGRDETAGDGDLPDGTNATLEALANYLENQPARLDAEQVRERFLDQTIEATGSDDLILDERFRYVESTTRVTTIAPESQFGPEGIYAITTGDRMIVAGYTNLLPGDNTIRVEAISGPSAGRVPVVWTDNWNTDGNWSVAMDTDGLEPGLYTLTVEADGETDDTVFFRVLQRSGNVTPG
jgi:major cell surface glycoprotein (TIGR04216 family)